jgi:hypothetical protein
MLDHWIMNLAAREQVGHFVADQFGNAQLALRSSSRLTAMLTAAHG